MFVLAGQGAPEGDRFTALEVRRLTPSWSAAVNLCDDAESS